MSHLQNNEEHLVFSFIHRAGGGGATRPLPRDGGMKELYGDPTARPTFEDWTTGQKWKK